MALYIRLLSHYHPDGRIKNEQFLTSIETTPEWILQKTGIKERRFLDDYEGDFPNFELAKRSLAILRKDPSFSENKVGLIISASTHDDIHYPTQASLISAELDTEVPSLQVKAACSSVAYAIYFSRALVAQSSDKEILIINGEAFTRYVDYGDRSSCILFGDAGCSVLLSSSPGLFKIIDIEIGGKGLEIVSADRVSPTSHLSINEMITGTLTNGKPKFNRRRGSDKKFQQDGKKVRDFVLTEIPKKVSAFLERNATTTAQLSYVISHQSNLVMMNQLWDAVGVPAEKHLFNVDVFGNTSAAGWVTVLSQNADSIPTGSTVLVSVFGAGMTWSNLLLQRT